MFNAKREGHSLVWSNFTNMRPSLDVVLEVDMKIELVAVMEADKSVLHQLMELYQYDFSEYEDTDVNAHGFYGYSYLDNYWTEDTRQPFFIKVDGNLAGFVLVSNHCFLLKEVEAKSISEFFVMRKYRRKGVGRAVACQVFDMSPGKWEVFQHWENLPSIAFWEDVIGAYTEGQFNKEVLQMDTWGGQVLLFDNAQRKA